MLVLCLVPAWILQKEDSSLSGAGEGGGLTPLGSGWGQCWAPVSSSLGMSHLTQEGPCGLAVPHKTSRRRRNFQG